MMMQEPIELSTGANNVHAQQFTFESIIFDDETI
jgi:hypothetical protein